MDILMALGITQVTDINMLPSYCMTMDTHMNLGIQHSLGQWTKYPKVASLGSMDQRGLSQRPTPEIL